jgi:sterol desaturase/sphingolipid hydroxylase (fatty acid hydroxylase superfamily)
VSPADWAAYKGRGVWLALSWAAAGAFLGLAPALARPLWPALVAAVPSPAWRFVLCVCVPNTLLTVLGNLFFAALYAGWVPAADAHRISSKPWPWRGTPAERERFWALLPVSLARVAGNHALLVPLLWAQHFIYAQTLGLPMFGSEVAGFPTTAAMLRDLAVCIVAEDVVFYAVHRALHTPLLYKHIHKIHHEYNLPIALASEHAHPLEFMFGNGLPVIVGPQLTMCHSFTFSVWILIRIATSIDNHCGYAFPLSPVRLLPFGSTAEGHDHHHAKNDGMIASEFTIADVLFRSLGTFRGWKAKKYLTVE